MFKGKELGTLTTNRLLQLGEGVGWGGGSMPTIDIPPLNSQKRGNLQDFRHSLDDWIPIDADLTIYTSTKLLHSLLRLRLASNTKEFVL